MNHDASIVAAPDLSDPLGLRPALEQLLEDFDLPATQHLALPQALGRVLATDVASEVDLPPVDVSAMDGFAIRCAALSAATGTVRLPVQGRSLAGPDGPAQLAPGTALRIMTGAPVPSGADAVLAFEDARARDDGQIEFPAQSVRPGANIRPRAEHVRQGEIVLHAGLRMAPAHIGLAASVGARTLEVRERLRIGVLSVGDELADAPAAIGPGASWDGNRPMILAALEQGGWSPLDLGIARDDPGAVEQVLRRASDSGLQVVLSSGGAAQGDADPVRALAGARFLAVPVRPGRGVLDVRYRQPGTGRTVRLLGLPGNPVAAWVLLHQLVLPALRAMQGGKARLAPCLTLALDADASVRGGRIDLRRARIVPGRDGPRARLVPHQGSAMLRGICESDVLVAIGPQPHYPQGSPVPAWPLASLGLA